MYIHSVRELMYYCNGLFLTAVNTRQAEREVMKHLMKAREKSFLCLYNGPPRFLGWRPGGLRRLVCLGHSH
jgi:hypothetical protein